ncbi:hypothetical protein [Bacillus sp. B1-b2]|nr:hypothetical protein [Bacillus sp. B1-b2]
MLRVFIALGYLFLFGSSYLELIWKNPVIPVCIFVIRETGCFANDNE